jgi:hypothetical protein
MIGRSFSYSNEGIVSIIEACRAAAYHNMELHGKDKKFNIHEDPVLFLGILCDELSTRDRFHASKNLSEIWSQRKILESSDIVLSLDPDISSSIAHFKILNCKFDINAITDALNKKLHDWDEIVKIS